MNYFKHILLIGFIGLIAACGNKNENNNSNNGCPAGYTFIANGQPNPYAYNGYNNGYYGNNNVAIASTNGNGQCVLPTTQTNTYQQGCQPCSLANNIQGVLVNGTCMDQTQLAATPNASQYCNGGYNNYNGYNGYNYWGNGYYNNYNYYPNYYRGGNWGPFYWRFGW